MALDKTVSYTGQKSVSTLGGQIRIDEGRGRMVIFDSQTQVELVTIDRTGFLFDDGVDRRIKIGTNPKNGDVVIAVSPPGEDVIDLLLE